MAKFLDGIDSPADIRKLSLEDLAVFAHEVREEVISVVSEVGGHLASTLGAVELTLALHYAFDTPRDRIVWDTGHQAYAHKLICGRRARLATIRQFGGLSAGLTFEGLNQAGHLEKDLIVVLNDNEIFIDSRVGAFSSFLSKKLATNLGVRLQKSLVHLLRTLPKVGENLYLVARKVKVKRLGVPDRFIPHGTQEELRKLCCLDKDAIVQAALQMTREEKKKKREGWERGSA